MQRPAGCRPAGRFVYTSYLNVSWCVVNAPLEPPSDRPPTNPIACNLLQLIGSNAKLTGPYQGEHNRARDSHRQILHCVREAYLNVASEDLIGCEFRELPEYRGRCRQADDQEQFKQDHPAPAHRFTGQGFKTARDEERDRQASEEVHGDIDGRPDNVSMQNAADEGVCYEYQ